MLGNAFESTISKLAATIATIPVDYNSLPQQKLNLASRKRTSLFPWRGQFSPELVDLLLTTHTSSQSVVLDPFVGSGTTLFEATGHDLNCYGAEINPAAIYLSSTAQVSVLNDIERAELFAKAGMLFEKYLCNYLPSNLFRQRGDVSSKPNLTLALRQMLNETLGAPLIYSILATAVMLAMGDEDTTDGVALERAYTYVQSVLCRLPASNNSCTVFAADARQLPLADNTVDLVLTSPPYINVFNYHQNYRKAIELMGWDVLKVAHSEIGANRKHRSNRFLTIIQYAIDMLQALTEMRRVIKENGAVVIVVGRESKVRGLSFRNGQLLAMLATGGAGFTLFNWQERCFTNRFGVSIYEDLLTFKADGAALNLVEDYGRRVGVWMLTDALFIAPQEVKNDLETAIREAMNVKASPLFAPQMQMGSSR